MSSSDAVLYVRSKLQQSRHRHQLPLSAVGGHDDDTNENIDHGLIILVNMGDVLTEGSSYDLFDRVVLVLWVVSVFF